MEICSPVGEVIENTVYNKITKYNVIMLNLKGKIKCEWVVYLKVSSYYNPF